MSVKAGLYLYVILMSLAAIPAASAQSLAITTDEQINAQVSGAQATRLDASGGTPPYAWTLSGGAMPGGLTLNTRGILTGTPASAGSYEFQVRVIDSLQHSVTKDLTVVVSSTSQPVIATPSELDSLQTGRAGSYKLDASGGAPPYSWAADSVLPEGFTLAGDTLLGRMNVPGTQTIRIRVTDAAGNSDRRTFVVSASRVAILSEQVSQPRLGDAYSEALSVAGGVAPYSWSVASGELPRGLSLSNDGIISGTPENLTPENSCVRISVRDSDSQVSVRRLCLAVQQPGRFSILTTDSDLPVISVGEPQAVRFLATGEAAPLFWRVVSGSLPDGLTIGARGELTGTSTKAGTFTAVIEARSAQGTEQKAFTLRVSPLKLETRLLAGTAGIPFTGQLQVSGGDAPFVWSLPAGSALPDGLAFGSGGLISGTPAASGRVLLPVRVEDANHNGVIRDVILEFSKAESSGVMHPLDSGGTAITTTSPLPAATVGVAYSQNLAASGAAPFTWTVTSGSLPSGITLSPAGLISGTPTGCGTYSFIAQVTDHASGSASQQLELGVNCSIQSFPGLSGVGTLGEVSSGSFFTTNFNAFGGAYYYTFAPAAGSTLPPGLTLTSDPLGFATLSGTPSATGSFSFSIQLTDGAGHSVTQVARLTVSPITITSATSYFGLGLNNAITPVTLTATGGTGSLTWSVVGGSLPSGLTLTAGGLLSGTPLETGNISATIRVTDSANNTRTIPFFFLVASGAATTIAITPQPGPIYAATGQPFSQGLSASAGTPPYTWSVAAGSSLPSGIQLVSGQDYSPQLWGVPTTSGTYNFSIQVTDSAGGLGVRAFTLNVSPLFDASGDLTIGPPVLNNLYSRQLLASGGTGPYTWALAPGSALPPGLSISLSGVVSGIPTFAGSSTFTLIVSDQASHTASFSYTLNASGLSLTNSPILPNAVVNSSYSEAFGAIGGTAPYSFFYFTPTTTQYVGFSLLNTGSVSGTPFTAGEYDFSTTSVDANGSFVTKAFSIFTVGSPVAPLAVSSPSALGETSAGSLSSFTLSASGGSPPYTWSVSSGALPPGLFLTSGVSPPGLTNFSPVGYPGYANVYGIPSAPGNYSFTLQVSDSASHTASQTFSIVVSPISILNTGLAGTLGMPYAHTLIATGGTSPYTWTLAAGSYLPAGLNLSDGVLTGAPQETGPLTFSLTATDSASASRTVPFTMEIASGTNCTITFLTAPQLANAFAGEQYTASISFVDGCSGVTTLSTAAGSLLPPGLQLEAAAFQIFGVPTVSGSYVFGVQATDGSGDIGVRYFRLQVTGLINTTFSVAPADVGTPYSQTFTVAGGTGSYTWSVCTGSVLPGGLNLSAGGVLSGTPTATGTFAFSLCVVDSALTAATVPVKLSIGAIAITTSADLPTITSGQNYSTQITASGGVPPYTWSLGFPPFNSYSSLPNGLTLNVSSGLISGNGFCCGSYFQTAITVTDSVGNTASKLFGGFEIPGFNFPGALFTTLNGALPTIPVDQPFSVSLTAFSENGPYTWSLTNGSIPPGLAIVPDPQNPPGFALAGVPTVPGNYIFTLRLADSVSSVPQTFSLTVSSLFSSGGPPSGTVGTLYPSFTFPVAGGTAPYVWSTLPGYPLPAGLSLSPAGVLSGTPSESGSFTLRLQITDATGALVVVNSSLFIASGTSQQVYFIGAYPMPTAFLQQEYNTTFTFFSGTGPYTWSITDGSLPPGLQLLPGSTPGSVSVWGAPTTAGTYSFTIKVTDSAGNTGYRTPVITVSPLANAVPSLPTGSVGAAYSQQLSVVGAAGPYTWSLLRGQYPVDPTCNGCFSFQDSLLPPGLTLSPSGSLSGTPLGAGIFNFQVMALDNSGDPLVISYSLGVLPLSITNASALPSAALTTTYSDQLTAAGGTPPYTFAGSPPPGLSLSTTGAISGTPTATGIFSFGVNVSDAANNLYSNTFSLLVTPTVDTPLTITWYGSAGYTTSQFLSTVASGSQISTAFVANGGVAPYTWSVPAGYILPHGLALTSDGTVTGLAEAPGNFTFAIRVTDGLGNVATKLLYLTVSPLKIYPNLPQGTVDTAYSTTLVAVGGTAPYMFGIGPGSTLPTGLSLDSAGHLTGTPTDTGQLSFGVRVNDANGVSFVRTVTLFIAAGTSLTYGISGTPLTDAHPDVLYSATVTSLTSPCCNDIPPYSWTLAPGSSLPAGLSLQGSSTSATISGVPTTAGHYSFRLVVADSAGSLGFQTFALNITPLINTTPGTVSSVVGSPVSQGVTVAGGSGPYTYAIAPGFVLPAGLTLSATGVISGTLSSPGEYTIGVLVTDAGGNTTVVQMTITANVVVITTAAELPNITIGQNYSTQLTATGGTPPYTWSLGTPSDASLPSGLSLNPATGVISGVTTCCSGFTATIGITITDSIGNSANQIFGVFEDPAAPSPNGPSISMSDILGTIPLDQAYSLNLSVFSPNGAYTWSVTPGSTLPPGLSLTPNPQNPTATQLTGTPAVAGNYIFTLKVTDSVSSASQTFSLSVSSLTTTTGNLPAGTVGSLYSATLTAVGGIAPYVWSTLPGYPLPAGLTLSPSGILSGTPTENGTFALRLRISDAKSSLIAVTTLLTVSSGTAQQVTLIGDYPMPTAFIQQEYNTTFTFSGGTGPYTTSVIAGSLPPGLQLLPGSAPGSISIWGEPTTSGTYSFTIQTVDSSGNTGYRTPVITVSPLANAVPTLLNGSVGAPYAQALLVVGAPGPYTWSALRGEYPVSPTCSGCSTYQDSLLPPGLLLSPSGSLSGTPTNPGTFNFQVMALDNAGDPLIASYTMSVTPITISNASALPPATVNTSYSDMFLAVAGTPPYTFVVPSTASLPVGVTLSSTGTLSGIPTAAGIYSFGVRVSDSASNSYSNTFSLLVSPTATAPLAITWVGTAGITTSPFLMPIASGSQIGTNFVGMGGVPPYVWSIPGGHALPSGMALTSAGNLVGLAETPGKFSFPVTVTDSVGNSKTQLMTMNVSPLKIYPNLPQGMVGSGYSTTLLAIGGAAPYSFTVGPGSTLPTGLSLDSAGDLTGTPTDTGQLSFGVRVTDANGATFVRTVGLLIASGTPTTLGISGSPLSDAQPGVFYSATVFPSGCCNSYSWSLAAGSSLPPGLSLQGSSSSATFSGTPTTPGHYSCRLIVTDSVGNQGFQTFTLNVTPLVDTTPGQVSATIGSAFSQTISVAGGSGPYTYALAPGYVLPPGFALSANGVLTDPGTAVVGQYTVGVLVTDSNGDTTVVQTTITVSAVGIAGSVLLPNAQASKPYSTQLSTVGGTAPYTWGLGLGSSLPAGLSLSSGGMLSGTPTVSGFYTVSFVVTDANFNSVTRTSGLYVLGAQPSPLTASTFSMSTPNATYCCFSASGGTPPYTWSVASGTLPPGTQISMDPFGRGQLVGVSSIPGNYTVEFQVTDANGVTAFSTSTITVTQGSLIPAATLNSSYSSAIPMTGGTPPYQFVLGPNAVLPAGMALSMDGVLSGAPVDTGSQNFDVVVTDAASNISYRTIPFTVNATGTPTVTVYTGASDSTSLIRFTTVSQANLGLIAFNGTYPYVFSLGAGSNLPPGLSLSQNAIVGAPTSPGEYTTVVQATDANGVVGSRTLSFVVAPQFAISTPAFAPVSSSAPVSLNLSATGGTQPYTWSVPSNSILPPGLTLSPQGLLSGTPGAGGSFSFAAVVTDSSTPANQLTGTFSLTISPFLVTTTGPLPTATENAAYSTSFAATGGTPPYSFFAGSVPAGLTLSSAGTLSGTPTLPGAYTLTITAADSKGWVLSSIYHFYVVAAPTPFPLVAVPLTYYDSTILTGAPVSILLPATGGTPPYSWSVAMGSTLPPGMSLQQAGTLPVPAFTPGDSILTGVVTTPGIYTFTLNLTDSASPAVTVSRTYQVVASSLTKSVAGTLLGTLLGTMGTPMQYNFAPAGGVAPYTVSIWNGALPNGLTLSSAGMISGVPLDPGVSTVSLQIADSSAPSLYTFAFISFSIDTPNFGSTLQWSTVSSLNPYPRNGSFSMGLSATGGTLPYAFGLPEGATLPPGLALSGNVIIGTPTTAGKYTFPLTLTDAANTSLTRSFYVEISPIAVTPATLPGATQDSAYAASLSATGGTTPYSFAVNALPAGLSLTPGGMLSGTPTVSGNDPVNLSVYDSSVPANTLPLAYLLPVEPLPCSSCGGGPSQSQPGTLTASPETITINTPPNTPVTQTVNLSYSATLAGAPGFITLVKTSDPPGVTPWLSVSPLSGTMTATAGTTSPFVSTATLTITADPSRFTAGTTVTGTITYAAGSASDTTTVTMTVTSTAKLAASPGALNFTWNPGDPNPTAQSVSVSSSPTGATYSVSAATDSNGAWLSVPANAGGTAPGSFPVSINPANLGAGTYTGNVTVTPASGAAITIPVTLTIGSSQPTLLSVSPLTEHFALTPTSMPTPGQLVVSNAGGGKLSFTLAASSDKGWLSLTGGNSGSATAGTPQSVAYLVDPTGLAAGSYAGQILVSDTGSAAQATVNITLVVSTTQSVVLSRGGLAFDTVQGGPQPPSQSFEVFSEGAGNLNWSVSSQVFYNPQLTLPSTPNWLTASPASGASSGGKTGTTVTVSANAAGLPPGQYYGTVTVSAPSADNTPESVSVVLTVAEPAGPFIPGNPGQSPIQFGTGGVILVGTAGSSTPQTQTITLFNPTANPVQYSTTVPANGWLSLSPASGTLASGANSIAVTANFSPLKQGVQTGSIGITTADGSANVQVDVIATTNSSVRSASGPLPRAVMACSASGQPGFLLAVLRQPIGLVSLQASVPQLVQALAFDGCGNPLTANAGGAVQVTFSNGDAGIHLMDVGGGTWEGTWTPFNAATNVTVNVVATEGTIPQQGPTNATVTVTAASANSPGAITGLANAAAGAAAVAQSVTPGSYFAIYGTNLADTPCTDPAAVASTIPLPTTLGGTQVLLGGTPVPLVFACQTQINALVPQGMSANALAQVIVVRDATRSVPQSVAVVGLQPGIYTVDTSGSGQGIVEIAGTTLLAGVAGNTSRPATRGSDTLLVYATGLGSVHGPDGEPGPADGQAASSLLLFRTDATVTATIGGVAAPVQFSGLTPTLVALYQINVTVPDDAPAGNAVPLVITATDVTGAVFVSNTVMIAVQ